MAAKNLSNTVKPVLDANNVRFIGVGFDSRFVQPFVEGGFFKGGKLSLKSFNSFKLNSYLSTILAELYVDAEKEAYNALQYQT